MLFPTPEFALFFLIVLTISWATVSRQSVWKPLMIGASYFFYGAADPVFCLLLAGVTVNSQLGALGIARAQSERAAKWVLGATLTINLGALATFKYYGFFSQEIADTLDTVGLGAPLPLLTIALPIGISFYTFQAISYVVDVRRGVVEPASWTDATLYLSFFPQIVAGPIVRASEFLPQLKAPRDPSRVAVGMGMTLIAIGLVKKVAIADFLAREVADPVFAVPAAYGGLDVLLAAYAYTAQIYCDFSGYTDIAIGIALLMGFSFPKNFNAPYAATGFRDFWRRWHMTLSRFLRDYLYIPLGGNRGGRLFTYRNLLLTMLLGGLWHGAAWTFVIWGGFHGVMLAAEHAWAGRVRLPVWVRWFATFHLVVFGWILFRSQGLDQFWDFLVQIGEPGPFTLASVPVVLAIIAVIGAQVLPARIQTRLQTAPTALRPALLGVGLALTVFLVGSTVPGGEVPPFIYFQF